MIGAPPHVTYAAVTRIPNDMCEYDVAGGFIGRPVELKHRLSPKAPQPVVLWRAGQRAVEMTQRLVRAAKVKRCLGALQGAGEAGFFAHTSRRFLR